MAQSARRRLGYAALTIGLAAAVGAEVVANGHLGIALAFAVMPDLALLAGISSGLERGQLHPRAVPLYNSLHRYWGPAAVGIAALAGLGAGWSIAALAWAFHVSLDRSLGFDLRTREGFQRAPSPR